LLGQALGFSAMFCLLASSSSSRAPAVAGYFLLGSLAPVRELANAQVAGQADRATRGLALGVNETLFAVSRSLAAALAGVLFTVDIRLPFIAALIAIPIGFIATALARSPAVHSTDQIVAIASNSNVIIESIED
jgi:hypothetical protein